MEVNTATAYFFLGLYTQRVQTEPYYNTSAVRPSVPYTLGAQIREP